MSGYENGGNPFGGQMGGGGDVNMATQMGELIAKIGELSQKVEETRMMGESKSAENARQIAEIRESIVKQEAAAAGQEELGGMGDVEAPPAEDEMNDILTGVEEDGGEIVEGGEGEGGDPADVEEGGEEEETVPEEEVEEGEDEVEEGEEEEEDENENINKDELGRHARMRGKKSQNKLGKSLKSLGAAGPIIANLQKDVKQLTSFNKNIKKELEKEQQARMLDNRTHDAKTIVQHEMNMGHIKNEEQDARIKHWVELKNETGNPEALTLLAQSLPQISENSTSTPMEAPPVAMGAAGKMWQPQNAAPQRMLLSEVESALGGHN